MPKSVFASLVTRQELDGEKPFKNPRNAAAGSLRQKDSKVTAGRGLDIFVFNVQQIEDAELSSHKQSLDFLREQGFHTIPFYTRFDNITDVISELKRIGEIRSGLEYDIDGAVIKVDDLPSANASAVHQNSRSGRWLSNIRPKKRQRSSLI